MAVIEPVAFHLVDIEPETVRTDAIQSFVRQETPIVRLVDADGVEGIGYAYTIGTGGSAVAALLCDHLLPRLPGREAGAIEAIWHDLVRSTHATTVGVVTALALAAIDTALWDLRCRRAGEPLHRLAGGARSEAPAYSTECGWLHLSREALVDGALAARAAGFAGVKLKVGKPHLSEDVARLRAVREAVGEDFEIMVDCNQAFALDEAVRRARAFEPIGLAWIEEPLPADDLAGHVALAARTAIPLAVGESLYSVGHFREYMQRGACQVVQVDAARIGGITPWLKVAHAAEAFGLPVCPHFLMELHVSLVSAVPNGRYVEHIPQLGSLCRTHLDAARGRLAAPTAPGNGIDWDMDRVRTLARPSATRAFGRTA